MPHALHALWEHNRTKLNQILLDSARQSLLELCADPRFMGATPGLLMALNTWGIRGRFRPRKAQSSDGW